ncbi:kinase-like protein [Armillaria solidipes]|uniref:Kinase-like protein n=1 Tax=Armillaria solidipes TaxID=1076256 RepID=A0A2H3CT18_9AGAR|nr:kinase-like protein [Armillaria solidipes]
MSTGTVISEHARKPDPYEPDDQWKAKVKEKLSPGFNDMLLQSKRRLERDLKRFGEDKIDPAERQRLIGNYLASERQIKDSETESFRVQVENERERRRRASGYGLRVGRREDLQGELGPMSGIGGQRSGADSGEAPAESPARSLDSQKQMATVKLMCAIAPASVATRPSPIPSSTPKDSGIFLLWTKPAVDDKLTPLGRRTSQASPRTSSPQIFRPAPIPEGQKGFSSRSSPTHGSQAADVWSWSTAHSLASPSASSTTQVSDPRRSAGEQQGEPAWRQWAKEARKREETKKKEDETKRKEEEMQQALKRRERDLEIRERSRVKREGGIGFEEERGGNCQEKPARNFLKWRHGEGHRKEQERFERRRSFHSWTQTNLERQDTDLRTQIQSLLRGVTAPWRSVELISPSAEIMVMDVLQQELDDLSCPDEYRPACMKCLQVLSRTRNIVPSSFSCRDVTREGTYPVWGGGFSDIWKGRLHDTQVCLKVLRIFISGEAREKVVRLVSRACYKPDFILTCLRIFARKLSYGGSSNVLPFLGVSEDLFAPSYCLISPWMINGNIISYLEAHPDHDRLMSLVQIAEGMQYLHNLDPPIVHADIRGANNLVTDDLCYLADFGLSLLAESQGLDSSSRMRKGGIRWLAPEYILLTLFDRSYVAARDIYAYGCTVIEVFTGEPPYSNIKHEAHVMHEVLGGNRPPRPPQDVFPHNELWSLVTDCLNTPPSKRPDARAVISRMALPNRPTYVKYDNELRTKKR